MLPYTPTWRELALPTGIFAALVFILIVLCRLLSGPPSSGGPDVVVTLWLVALLVIAGGSFFLAFTRGDRLARFLWIQPSARGETWLLLIASLSLPIAALQAAGLTMIRFFFYLGLTPDYWLITSTLLAIFLGGVGLGLAINWALWKLRLSRIFAVVVDVAVLGIGIVAMLVVLKYESTLPIFAISALATIVSPLGMLLAFALLPR
jgi:hypothetical protein